VGDTRHQQMQIRGMQRVKEAVTCLKLNGHDPKTGLLLDLGCGGGYLHEHFLKEGIEAVGVEIIRNRIRYAKKHVPKGNFVLADGCNLPFRKECFSTVITNDVLEHVTYVLANSMLDEVKRTIKTDGLFYISVANRYQIHEPHTLIPFLTWFPRSCWNPIHKILRKQPMNEMYYPYTVSMLKRLCNKTNFSYTNFTWMYALNKTSKTDYIGNRTVRKIAQAINKIGFSRAAQILAEKVSIIVFVCGK
jgi:2-polyprenyl-3-methyl-5-hydroxy-6-metoxy-1,4-benzoquinol methylase